MRDSWNVAGGGYQEFAAGLLPAVEALLDWLALPPEARVLDVATGTGLAALAAAQRGARVTALDFAPDLLAEGRRLAAGQGLAEQVQFVEGDAEQLPFANASFDAVISSFGAMFAPRHERVAAELARVARPGGLIGLASWLPEPPHCELLALTAPYLPPRTRQLPSPLDWGRPDYLAELLGPSVQSIEYASGNAPWRVPSEREALALLFRRGLGPTIYVYQQFDSATKLAVREDALCLLRPYLRPDGSLDFPRAYLLVKAVRRR